MSTHCLGLVRSARLLLLGGLVVSATACAAGVSVGSQEPEYGTEYFEDDVGPLGIPEGHLPPPGECRIWYPDRPAGQQPPPLGCTEAMARAPLGTWVLHRPRHEEVHARVMDARRAGVVARVRIFDALQGRYLRTERR